MNGADSRAGGTRRGRRTGGSERGVSEFAGVAILVGITVIVTATVGMSVLLVEEDTSGPPDANFSFQYIQPSSSLIVTFDRGGPIAAGNISIRGNGGEATWAAIAGTNESAMIGPNSPSATIQVSPANDFGARVPASGPITVYYTGTGNETVIDRWDGRSL